MTWTKTHRCEEYIDPEIGTTTLFEGPDVHCAGLWVFIGWRRNTVGLTMVLVQSPDPDHVDRYSTAARTKWITHMDIVARDFPSLIPENFTS